MTDPDFIVAIPARHGASRLPGKPLRLIAGEPMVLHVARRALAAGARAVVVATDDERIADAVRSAGVTVCMTRADHPSGTDRLAECASQLGWSDQQIVVNLQGDEPLIEPEAIETLVDAMLTSGAEMGTLARPLEPDELDRPQVVKVVTDLSGHALYFSRAAIPHRRSGGVSPLARAHVGIYGFTASFLERFAQLSAGRLEGEEALEQLRALEHGVRIRVADTAYRGFGIDTPEDLERARVLLGGKA